MTRTLEREPVVIVAAARTPIGGFGGALAPLSATDLGAAAVRGALEQAGLDGSDVDAVYLGNVLSAGVGQAPARQAARRAGLPDGVPAVTVNKVCGSGLEALLQAYRAVVLGDAEIALAGGMESMSNAPYLLPGARRGLRLGDGAVVDHLVHDGLQNAYDGRHMGSCAELCAARYSFSRAEQDAYAERSYRRAQEAVQNGLFNAEIVPVTVPGRKGSVTVAADEEPSRVDFAKLPTLRPAFEEGGTVTAGNASTLSDGAAALVVCTAETARRRGLAALATIDGYSAYAGEPAWFTTAPVGALKKLFANLEAEPGAFDLFEINEAFAVVPLAATRDLSLPAERVNVHGGAVALGHPIGASGARFVVTLVHALRGRGEQRGAAAICIGGGEALALAVSVP